MIALIENLNPEKFSELMAVCADEVRGHFERDGKCCFVPYIFISEFVSVVISLHNLALIFPENYSRDVNTSGVGKYGEKYREEHTPKYMLLDANKPVLFLVQQFPFLYNTIRARKATGSTYDRSNLTSSFLAVIEGYWTRAKSPSPWCLLAFAGSSR